MRTKSLKKSNVSTERILALDELLPKKSTQYDSSPGVYVRSDKERELDVLWQGYRVNAKEEKSPLLYLSSGFIAGVVSVLVIGAILNFGNPSKDNIAELNLWEQANTKPAPAVNVTPSVEITEPVIQTTAEYRVKSGDTLERIAYRFYGSGSPSKIDKIQVANNLRSPHSIRAGQKLIIPIEE